MYNLNVKEFFDGFAAMGVISRRCSGRITHVIYFRSNLVHHNELVDNELICKVMRTVKKVNSALERAWEEIDAMGACDSDGYGYVDVDKIIETSPIGLNRIKEVIDKNE